MPEQAQEQMIEDQTDVDMRYQEEMRAKAAKELAMRSQVIQRDFPRPQEVNLSVLRPPNESYSLTELQRAEELIKLEMATMLQYDNLKNPLPTQTKQATKSQAQQLAFLEEHPYSSFRSEELDIARYMLKREMEIVKKGMGHGELPMEAYKQVWEECLGQVLFLPNQNRYTRANLASKKDRLESAERRLEQNRAHMAREAKRAAKMEKKLKILTGGYQSRAQALIKQLQDMYDNIDQANLELNTFKFLQEQERGALPRRIQSLTEDVNRQMEREKSLQKRYSELQTQIRYLQEQYKHLQQETAEAQKQLNAQQQETVTEEQNEVSSSTVNGIASESDNDEMYQGNEEVSVQS